MHKFTTEYKTRVAFNKTNFYTFRSNESHDGSTPSFVVSAVTLFGDFYFNRKVLFLDPGLSQEIQTY